ncbi:hypothetical protein [Umezawaea sp.]|uniref:hypothetical protein n=1 Tax=Umezawaea sp. TaxID=1955258 RepID=UPI002ECFC2CB
MLQGFIDFLDDYLERTGISGLIRGVLGVLAFASLLSAIFGTIAIKAGALVIATMCLLGVLLMLTTHHRTLRAQANEHRLLLSRYCDVVTSRMNPTWHIHRWSEAVDIAPNGDVLGSVTIHASVEAEALHFLRVCLGPNWAQPERTRRKVRVSMTGLEIMGTGSGRWSETSRWQPDGRLEILAHCVSKPPGLGDQIRLRLEYEWPGKCVPLMRHDRLDEFVCLFSRDLDQLDYRITLPVGTRAKYDPVGLDKDNFDLSLYTAKHKRPVVELVARDVDADHRVGMRLDLR